MIHFQSLNQLLATKDVQAKKLAQSAPSKASSALLPLAKDTVSFSGNKPPEKIFFGSTPSKDNPYGLEDEIVQMAEVLGEYLEKDYRAKLFPAAVKEIENPEKTKSGQTDYMKKYGSIIKVNKALAEMGVLGIETPAEYGGLDMGTTTTAAIAMKLGYEDPGMATTVMAGATNGLFGKPILAYGTEAQKLKYLNEINEGKKMGAFALTEPGSGSDAGAMLTKAEKINGKWVLNGEKTFITNGHIADYQVVLAKTIDKANGIGTDRPVISAFIVHKDDKGVSTQDIEKMGQHTSDTAIISYADVELDDSRLVGGEAGIGVGKDIYNKTLIGGRIGVGAMAAGAAERGLDAAVEYAKDRTQFKNPVTKAPESLAEKPIIRRKLAKMAIDTEVSKLASLASARLKDQSDEQVKNGGAPIPFVKEASMSKLFATEKCLETLKESIQIHGGNGYTMEYVPARMYQDARVFSIYEGTSEIQTLIIARETMGELMKDSKALENLKAEVKSSPSTMGELADKAYAQLILGVTDQFMTHMGQSGDMMVTFAQKQDVLEDMSYLISKRYGLEVLSKHVDSLKKANVPHEKAEAMKTVFEAEFARELLDKAVELSGDATLYADPKVQQLLAQSGQEVAAATEVVAKAVIG